MENKLNIEQGKVVFDPFQPHLGGNIKGGDKRCEDHDVWKYLIDHFYPGSICDVGCGEGQLMLYFQKRGIVAYGVDGLKENQLNSDPLVKDHFLIWDYNKGVQPLIFPVDLVISCEFVEHVEEQYISNYLPQFLACKYLVFTHAVPNQNGHHHVNCQTDQYWIDLMIGNNFEFLVEETTFARSLVKNSFWGTLLIFKRR